MQQQLQAQLRLNEAIARGAQTGLVIPQRGARPALRAQEIAAIQAGRGIQPISVSPVPLGPQQQIITAGYRQRRDHLAEIAADEQKIASQRLAAEGQILARRVQGLVQEERQRRSVARDPLTRSPLARHLVYSGFDPLLNRPGLEGTDDPYRRTSEYRRQTIRGPAGRRLQSYRADPFLGIESARLGDVNRGRVAGYYTELQRGARIQSEASQQMRRHGALTTEFLQALARGETTLAEFRFQMGATIGKFAGWTAAATAVYGVVGAIGALGQGAVAQLTGVRELSRYVTEDFDADAAGRRFRDLSYRFNVPLETVAQASTGVAQVYKDQEQALTATEVVLKAVRVGNIEAADATKYFGAIARGFRLDAKELPVILDQFNEAQNRLGLTIPDSAAGVARAAASWNQAGGSIEQLVALMGTLRYLSGETGTTVGTALVRSVANVRRPSNIKTLQRYGINPEGSIDQIFQQAIERAPSLDRFQRLDLAAHGLSTPQYGRFFTALLGNTDVYRRVQGVTDPQRAKGSADKELKVVLSEVREQITRIGVQLGILGANLASSGLLDVFGGLLQTLNLTLRVTNQLLELFNLLPEPLRKAAAYGVELYGAAALLRRTGLGSALAERTGIRGLGASEAELARRDAIRTGRAVVGNLANEREQVANRLVGTRSQIYIKSAQVEDLNRERQLLAAQGGSQQQLQRAQQKITAETKVINALREEDALLTAQQATIARQHAATQAEVVALQKRRIGVAESSLLAGAGGAQTPVVARPPRVLSDQGRRVQTAMALHVANTAVLAENLQRQGLGVQRLGVTGRALERAGYATARITGRTVTRLGRVGGALRGAGAGLGGVARTLASSLGPLDYLLLGGLAAYEIVSSSIEKDRQTNERIKRLRSDPKTQGEIDKQLKEATKLGRDDRSFGQRYGDALTQTFRIGKGRREREIEEAQKTQQRIVDEQARINTERVQGGVASRAPIGNIARTYEGDLKTFKNYADFRRSALQRIEEVYQSTDPGSGASRALISRIRNDLARRAPLNGPGAFDPFEGLRGADSKVLEAEAQRQAAQVSARNITGQRTGRNVQRLAAIFLQAVRRYGRSRNADALKVLVEARQELIDAATEGAQEDLQLATRLARTAGQKGAAHDRYQRELRARGRDLRRARRIELRGLAQAEQDLDRLVTEGLQDPGAAAQTYHGTRGTPGQPHDILESEIRHQRATVRRIRTQTQRSGVALRRAERELQALLLEDQRTAFQERAEHRDVVLAYNQSRTTDPGKRTSLAIRDAGTRVRDAIRTFGRGSDEALREITRQNELRQQSVESDLETVRSIAALRTSRIGGGTENDLARARSDIQGIRDQIAAARRGGADKNTVRDLQTQLNNAENALAQDIIERARAIADARLQYRLAGVTDPVRRARLELGGSIRGLKGLRGADRIQQLAQIKENRQSLRQSIVDEDLEQARFEHNVGRQTDEQYIATLRNILKTKKLSKQLRRQLLEEIYGLEHQQEDQLELNVGNIRLPTLYEVRRAQKQGASLAGNRNFTNNTTLNVNIRGREGLDEFGRMLEGATGITHAQLTAEGVI